MKKRLLKVFLIPAVCIFVILVSVYVGLGMYYEDRFNCGTWINGIYCTGKTISEANDALKDAYSYPGLKICFEDGSEDIYISSASCNYRYDYQNRLKEYIRKQKPWIWPINLFKQSNDELLPEVSIDKMLLEEELNQYDILDTNNMPEVMLILGTDGYKLIDGTQGRADGLMIRQYIEDALLTSKEEIVINDDFYFNDRHTDEQLEVINRYKQLKKQLTAKITYVMGDDREVIDEYVLAGFLKKDSENNPVIADGKDNTDAYFEWDTDKIEAWVDRLCKKYNTVGAKRKFLTSKGKEIVVEGGIYGNEINASAEKEYLINAVTGGTCEEHEPEYIKKAYVQGLNDIGNTYIEVNMTDQMLYYYADGILEIETPVVTGNMLLGRDTPSGVNYVYFKQLNRTLHGADYTSFVKYWIAVKGAIGIHDASWRDEYGGKIYLTDGSHGCINTPEQEVSKLYDMVELGTPAVMFYLDE